jgi:hypothetical protein
MLKWSGQLIGWPSNIFIRQNQANMLIVKCPNCGMTVEVFPEFLGRQVGCIKCRHVYILSEQYHDFRYRRLVILNTVLITLLISGIFVKIELDHGFIRKYSKLINKTVTKKMDQLVGEKDTSGKLEFYDFDKAYGTVIDKIKRTQPIVLPIHKDRVVEWGGEVLEVYAVIDDPYGDYYIKFRQSHGASSDVTVYFRDDQAETLADIQIGHYIEYQGIIVSAAYGNTNHILRRGKILP